MTFGDSLQILQGISLQQSILVTLKTCWNHEHLSQIFTLQQWLEHALVCAILLEDEKIFLMYA